MGWFGNIDMSHSGLSNLQQELLQLYGNGVSDESLMEIKGILAQYFAERATSAMDDLWDDRGLTSGDMSIWAREHNRLENRS